MREAAVDLVGQHLQTRPDLIDRYLTTVRERILDTGVSVRKRVVKILKDICLKYPDHSAVPAMCIDMLSRIVNDEESVVVCCFAAESFTSVCRNLSRKHCKSFGLPHYLNDH